MVWQNFKNAGIEDRLAQRRGDAEKSIGQKSEVGSRRSEVGGQTSEGGGRKDRGQTSPR